MTTSTDGLTWSPVVRVPIDATTSTVDHFIPGISADKSTQGGTAHLGLTFYFYPKSNCTISTCSLQAGFVSSQDGGTTWSAPVKVVGPMHLKWLPSTTLGYMVGDYISTSFGSNGKAYTVVAKATTTTNCTTNQVGSCHEFMVAPTNGLLLGPGVTRVDASEQLAVTPSNSRIPVPSLP